MLGDAQKRLYARQILVAELGAAGQQQLCAAHVAVAPDADPQAAAVADDYLRRAGLQASAAGPDAQANALVAVADAAIVRAVAGDPALIECAAWLCGAFAAVETIKQVAGVGKPAELDSALALAAEID